jgi:hypothetical protein
MTTTTRRQVLKTSLAANAALSMAVLADHVHVSAQSATPAAYKPQTRDMTVAMVPVLVHEMTGTFPSLTNEFAKGGLLDGKEIYAFMPSTLIAYAGDSLSLHIYNPTDDPHTFTVVELSQSVTVAGLSVDALMLKAVPAGIYTLICAVVEHVPFMWGQIVVLQPPA